MEYAFQNDKNLYFVLEFCPGGSLSFHLGSKPYLAENVVKFYASNIVLALGELHKHDVVYRDLKLENILIAQDGFARLTDFGFSKQNVSGNKDASTVVGNSDY